MSEWRENYGLLETSAHPGDSLRLKTTFCSGKSLGFVWSYANLGSISALAFMALGKLLKVLMPHLQNGVNDSCLPSQEDEVERLSELPP